MQDSGLEEDDRAEPEHTEFTSSAAVAVEEAQTFKGKKGIKDEKGPLPGF